jgi:tetratricopeptide (TPR) repeat protein
LLSESWVFALKLAVGVILGSGFIVGLIWLLSAGYQGWQAAGRQQSVQAHMTAGERYFKSKSYQAAIQEFNEALKLSSDPEMQKVARRNIAIAYTEMGIQAEETGDVIRAVAFYKQSLVSDGTYTEGYLFLGNAWRRVHRDDDALAAWEEAIKLGGGGEAGQLARQNAAVIYHERGDNAYQQGNTDLALAWWRKALEVAPGTQAGILAQEKIERVVGG